MAQAAHIPVHLGAMPASAAAALRTVETWQPGDLVVLNDPYEGGTHLPDVTMISPVFAPSGEASDPQFFVASRAHHADVGGMTPGSLPLSTEIYQEGVIIPPVKLYRAGVLNEDLLRLVLRNVRTPDERRGDLAAQRAAHAVGERRLHALMDRHGTCATIRGDGITFDFAGTDPAMESSLNAVLSITESACYYVVRCLATEAIPVNAGCFAPVMVTAPEGCLVNARPPAAVAGGNVETSQRITDVVLGAMAKALPERVPAASQGTMNNLTIGGLHADGSPYAYYETIGGGMGAAPDADGLHGVHVHMSNTLNTPAEALELAFPFRITQYGLRDGSGGGGHHGGGNGVVREYLLLRPATVTMLSERRAIQPWGLAGGQAGQPGRNVLLHADGGEERLPAKFSRRLAPGDRLRIETPGGGGWGRAIG